MQKLDVKQDHIDRLMQDYLKQMNEVKKENNQLRADADNYLKIQSDNNNQLDELKKLNEQLRNQIKEMTKEKRR